MVCLPFQYISDIYYDYLNLDIFTCIYLFNSRKAQEVEIGFITQLNMVMYTLQLGLHFRILVIASIKITILHISDYARLHV